MTSYGHRLLFGVVLTPDATDPERTVDLATHADRVGLDVVSVSDHQYQPRFLDAWTLLSWIAARTQQVTVMPNVANLPLRPPAGLARAAASLDAISGGRVELGLGAGGHASAIHGEGGPYLPIGDRIDALAEAAHVIRALTTPGPPVTFSGRYYHLAAAAPGPPHPHPIGLWVGAVGPRMLRLVGRIGDGWIPSATRIPPSRLDAANAHIDAAARAAGREPGTIRRLYNIPAPAAGLDRVWAHQLAEVATRHGISGFLLFADDRDTITRFADITPEVREAAR